MKARGNTRVSILRGTTTDAYGYPADLGKPVATGITAAITERTKQVTTPGDLRPRTVRSYAARLPARTDVRNGDRLQDERTGRIYIVDGIADPSSTVRTPDVQLDLRRIN